MQKKITVIGATGLIGVPVTKALLEAGFEVTAMVRNPDKARQILPAGIRCIKGDLQIKADILAATQSADGVYINLNATFIDKENGFNAEREGLDNILEVLKSTSAKQVGFLSSFLARDYRGEWWVMKMKQAALSKIKNSGLRYTIFYAASFMENLENSMRNGKAINTIGKPTPKLSWWIASEDFAKQVAKAFSLETAINKEYSIQGPKGLTTVDAIKIYIANHKELLKMANLPMGMAKFLSLFIKPLKFAVPLIETINNDNEKFEATKTWEELGKPQTTIEAFAKR
ncbi:SDR family oxidoreductase [Chitinophaga tropicalis]|uniref:NAD(P)H-binding protein n=1 Tax=Chitinophaga tropicalis TaxID=2683588 RepID=A0A7K1UD37_9BACT|nr:NAD(P)H-binding protein [Chitinophaga tropicalis]MVT12236.1 NAD(P)H-binding protein [Chitinophaga tropicalis]